MKLQYLGTAAAESIPAIFCECDVCKKSRELGGRNIRSRSQALLDDTLLIDFPADTYMHFINFNMPLHNITSCLITHSHGDHLYTDDIVMRKSNPFARLHEGYEPLTFYSDTAGYEKIAEVKRANRIQDKDVLVKKIELFKPFDVQGYEVTALRATHDEASSPVVYIIEKNGKSLFYSNDTSEYPENTMEYLATLKKPLDLISFDCTSCNSITTWSGHLDLQRCVALRERLMEIGAADKNTKFILNHFSHNGKDALYEDFVKVASEFDFDVSYDGMIVEF